ncbi:MAG: family 16 glycosylhydrolase [Bacteroidetes bacterium]|nr:family 16 glycosylhydrolase [Bacteroidota bacterium]
MRSLIALFILLSIAACKKDDGGDPDPQKPTISVADVTQAEGNADNVMDFTIRLSQAAQTNVLVNYSTLSGTAQAGVDFVAIANQQLIFGPGETEKKVSVEIIGDDVEESDESFELVLLNPANAVLGQSRAKGTITNDDNNNALNIPTSGYSTPETYPGRTLVWQDEFNSNTLNTSFWTHEMGNNGGWGNNELQYYRPENTYSHDGKLIIEARQENFSGSQYTSSRMVTKGKKEFKYGRIDIRAALPKGKGIWPAFWMLGSNFTTAGWPACGEIDIMEMIGSQPGTAHGTVHYGTSTATHQQRTASKTLANNALLADAFHVFSMEWEENRIRWYLDDVQFHEVTPATLGAGQPWPFNQNFFFIFNLAVGGNWPGSPDGSTIFPQRLVVDYVRVFQ